MAAKMLPRKRLSAASDDAGLDADSAIDPQQQLTPGAAGNSESALPYTFLPVQVARKRKKTSWVWHHFVRGGGENERNVCRHCLLVDGSGDATSYPKTTGNSTLAVHLLAKHGIAKGEIGNDESSIPGTPVTPVAPAPRVVSSNGAVEKALAVAAAVATGIGTGGAPVSHADHVFQTPPTKAATNLNAQQQLQNLQQQQPSQVVDVDRKSEIDDALLDFIVDAHLGLDVLERASFRVFCKKVNPNYEPLTRDVLATSSDEQLHQALQKFFFVVQAIPGSVALTLDQWSTPGYIGLTLHWVSSDWALKKCLLEFKHAPPAFDAWCVSELIVTTLHHYNISTKVRAITTDSARELEASMVHVRLELQNKFAVQVSESWHLRCVSHILHQCVSAALEKITLPLATLRTILKYLRDSDALKALYKAVQQQAGKAAIKDVPSLDVENNWDALFAMLDESYAVKDVLGVVCSSEAGKGLRAHLQGQQRLSDVDWRTLKCTRDFLEQAVAFTTVSEEHDFIGASLLPLIYDSLQAHCKKAIEGRTSAALGVTITPLAKSAAAAFLDVLQKNKRHLWNDFANLAQILDPRVSNASVEAVAMKTEIRRTLVEQYGLNVQESLASSVSETHASVVAEAAPVKPEKQISSLFAAARQARNESYPERVAEDEVDAFFKFTTNADLGCDDVLEWWRVVGAHRFPKMSLLARDTLMIMGSALPPRAFTGSDQLVTRKSAVVNEVKGLEIATKVRAWRRFV